MIWRFLHALLETFYFARVICGYELSLAFMSLSLCVLFAVALQVVLWSTKNKVEVDFQTNFRLTI